MFLLNLLKCVAFLCCWMSLACAVEYCSLDAGGGVCPDKNTCCPTNVGSGCIPSDMGALNATCCSDRSTACGVGYICGPHNTCVAGATVSDPFLQFLPRYKLCQVTNGMLKNVQGLNIDNEGQLAYYSTHGDLTTPNEFHRRIQMVLVVIHGANRNADDYFCSSLAALNLQTTFDKRSILVVAPRFLVPSDGPVAVPSPLRWQDIGAGPWRYGASAIGTSVSSFHAMDSLLHQLHNATQFPNVKLVTVAGHSSGGQFVQRWSLLTTFWSDKMRAVVANPSSYAYLEKYRYHLGAWIVPDSCPQYNQWEWGMDLGGNSSVSYKIHSLDLLDNNMTRLVDRFGSRRLLYLVGSLDKCNVTHPGWCHSHGLETTCMDEVQGSNRWQRNLNYFASLLRVGIHSHNRLVVEGVGHDHALMLTSPTGLYAIFGNEYNPYTNHERNS